MGGRREAVEAERDCVQNRVAQIASYKDAMVCVGEVVQLVEVLYKFLQERAHSEEGGVGLSRCDSRPPEAASGGMVAQGNAAGKSNPSGSLPKPRAGSPAEQVGAGAGGGVTGAPPAAGRAGSPGPASSAGASPSGLQSI